MKGYTADISTICEYEWYEWVIYNETTWELPDPKFVLGQYLGPSIYAVSTKTSKILRKNDEAVPRSTLCYLTMEEMDNPDLQE